MPVGEISTNAMTVLEKRYLAKDENGRNVPQSGGHDRICGCKL